MNSVPEDLRALMRLLEEAGGREETYRRVRLRNGRFIRLTRADDAEWRFRYRFKGLEVTLETPAAEKAVVAALAALKGKPTQPRRMRYALAMSENIDKAKSAGFDSLDTLKQNLRKDPRLQGARGADRRNVPVARLLNELLRHYRGEFDELPEHKRAALMEQAASHLNTFLESLRKLTSFLEAGDTTAGIPKTKLKITQQQLRAAELADVLGFSHREIGAALGLPLTDSDKRQGGHQKAKERVRQGRKLLHLELLGKLAGEPDERPVVNVLVSAEWLTIRATMLETLAPYPEARVAVAESLMELEAG